MSNYSGGGIAQAIETTATPTFAGGTLTGNALTDATMTKVETGTLREGWSRYDWTNAMVVALGASLTGDVKVCTLPAKTMVRQIFVVINGAGAGVTTLTVAVGRTGAAYIDYIVASDAKAAANTIYGRTAATLGTNMIGYDVPSWTAPTDIFAHFISTVQNLSATTGSSGSIYIETTRF